MNEVPEGSGFFDQMIVLIVIDGTRKPWTATRVTVNKTEAVASLSSVVGGDNRKLCFLGSGQILTGVMSLGFYGLTNGAQILVLEKDVLETLGRQRWNELASSSYHKSVTRNAEKLDHLSMERSRLRDLRLARIESKKKWIRTASHAMRFFDSAEDTSSPLSTCIPDRACALSSAELPVCW